MKKTSSLFFPIIFGSLVFACCNKPTQYQPTSVICPKYVYGNRSDTVEFYCESETTHALVNHCHLRFDRKICETELKTTYRSLMDFENDFGVGDVSKTMARELVFLLIAVSEFDSKNRSVLGVLHAILENPPMTPPGEQIFFPHDMKYQAFMRAAVNEGGDRVYIDDSDFERSWDLILSNVLSKMKLTVDDLSREASNS